MINGILLFSASDAGLDVFFTRMIGTLAVILVVAAFIGGSDLLRKFFHADRNWKYSLLAGILGGVFGIYGNISGVNLNGAVISVRDIGPMLAGFTGGPIGGIIAGVIAGAHRLFLGGITAPPCIIATCCIGTICGLLSWKFHDRIIKPLWALLLGVVMEVFHLGLVLLMVKPFETALGIVKAIAIPFILVNAAGFALMITIITYIEKQRRIALERNRLQSELEVATVIQRSLLPPITDSFPGRAEFKVSGSMEPAKEVGGDFYDLFFVDRDRIAFVIADVSGKGIPAALFMATSKTTIQNCIRDLPSLADAVSTANNSLCGNNEAEMFVTAWIGVLEIPTGKLTFISAGHNPPSVITSDGAVFLKRRNGFVLGGMEDVKYREETYEMKKGDALFLYTDGVTEAENKDHELFGEDRLKACLDGAYGSDPGGVIGSVKASVAEHVKGFSQFDDMTMLCIRLSDQA
ncbi:MAG: SpoIIE family protein phosphatase [Clostridia bacterium]|nr:SpoIIE family protein phosphatase [Clostridia bacterium]